MVSKALAAGAVVAGDDEVIEAIQNWTISFDRCICHESSVPKLATVARILGPKGLMPNTKQGTIVKDIPAMIQSMSGSGEYRESGDVVQCPIGQLAFTPDQLKENIKEFVARMRQECAKLSAGRAVKSVHDIVRTL